MVDDAYLRLVGAFVRRWRTLRSWGRVLTIDVKLELWPGPVDGRLGQLAARRVLDDGTEVPPAITVYCTGNLADDVATVLHELAHAACRASDGHSFWWRDKLARATIEATAKVVVWSVGLDDHLTEDGREDELRVQRKTDLDRSVTDAVEAMLRDEGWADLASERGWGWRR